MTNRLVDLESTITRSHKTKAAHRNGRRPPVARKPQGVLTRVATMPPPAAPSLSPAPAVAKGLSALVSRWPARAASKAHAFGAVDYTVPGLFSPLAQPHSMACWATVFTMMWSWRRQQSLDIETSLAALGQRWLDMYRADTGLPAEATAEFMTAAGLVAEPPRSYSVEGWEQLLRNYGPVWVTTDELPGKGWAIHARVITAISGDGTADNTFFTIVDPNGGRTYRESIAVFIPKYQEEVIQSGYMRIQVVHWTADARAEVRAQSFGGRTTRASAVRASSLSAPGSAPSVAFDYSQALAAHRQALALSQSFDVRYNVELIPQQTGFSCWAAGFAMIVGWRDQVSINPSEIARATGYWAQYQSGLHPEDTRVMSTWGFVAEPPQSYMIEAFVDLLRRFGPLWIASAEPGPHIRVITGIHGDGTPDGTILHINDPWEQGMTVFNPNNRGSQYTETFTQFEEKQATLVGQERSIRAPIYIAHLPQLPDWMNTPTAQSFSHYIGRPLAMEAPSNPANYRLLTSGIWSSNTMLTVQGGQGMWFKIRNTNVLGTTIRITDQARQTKQSIILPASSVEFLFAIFGNEPMGWRFDISTESDAFMVTWELWSTWVPGMPPNR
ncbi:MAG TPA: papain-like cysteine protease family protein [Pyrinomonadaceae bacterium]|nr:papain-like cysteine protease family protein [Pyrinomonadaceae bacterium]